MNFTDPDEQIDMILRGNSLGIEDSSSFKMDFLEQPQLPIDPTSPILNMSHNTINGIGSSNGPTDSFLTDDYLVNFHSFPCIVTSPKTLDEFNNNNINNNPIMSDNIDGPFAINMQPTILPNMQYPSSQQPTSDNLHSNNTLNIANLNNLSGLNLANLNLNALNGLNINLNNITSENNDTSAAAGPATSELKSYVIPDVSAVSKTPSNAQILFLMKNMAKLAGSMGNNSNSKSKTEPLPSVPKIVSNDETEFESICADKALTFNPKKLGFIPSKFWEDKEMTFGELVTNFFRRKSNSNNRFYHKLFNALKISEDDPFYSEYVGVEWANPKVIKVDKKKFARLLGIKSIDGSLFHHQGNFPSHGFVELTTQNVADYFPNKKIENVDFDNVRLLVHQAGVFIQGCTEEVINDCKWINVRKGPQYYH